MRKRRILVVDDDEAQRRMFMRAFTEAGFEVDLAASADEARNLLAKNRYDLILLDLVLKTERCGLELLAWLKANDSLKNIPVIAMSGHHSGHPLLLEAYDVGARDAVSKPLAMKLMMRKAEEFIAEAHGADDAEEEADADTVPKDERARARVLVVEDEDQYQDLYRSFFEEVYGREFIYVPAFTGRDGLKELDRHPSPPIDIAIIDWNLPDIEGLHLLRLLRKDVRTRGILTLMVTAHTSGNDAGTALDRGMDDYLRKPWAERELVGRLRSLLRRREQVYAEHGGYELDGLSLDLEAQEVQLDGKPVAVRTKEFALLELLLRRPDQIHSQGYLGEALTPGEEDASPEAVRKQISNLRQALGPWADRIEALRGRGYKLHTRFPALPG